MEAQLSGAALGQLDRALARLHIATQTPLPTYGDLSHIHPLVPEPLSMIETLPADSEDRLRIKHIVFDALAALPNLESTLPRQIIHSDFARSNLLLHEERVTGILDFEFAGPDIRAMDLACGLWSFSVFVWGSGNEWPLLAEFAQGYLAENSLTAQEVEALPTLLRLREMTALVHWAGRWRQKLAGEDSIAKRVAGLLALDEWLQANDDALILSVSRG